MSQKIVNPDFSKVNRVEVINHTKSLEEGGGRTVIAWAKEPLDVSIDLQDGDRTLKLFVGFGNNKEGGER
jgi:hypothetical protein